MTEETLRITYNVRATAADIHARAESLLLEQTVELPRAALRDREMAQRMVGRVEDVLEVSPGVHRVTLSQPLAATASDPAQLLNVIFGNSSLQPDVVLADVDLPGPAFDWLPGPRAGLDGIRARTGVIGRPLLATALKPMGLGVPQLAALCRTFATAGIDLVKDDHGLADHAFCPFEARVEACLRATEGTSTVYVPNLIGTPERVFAQLGFARRAGVAAVLLSPMVVGLPLLHQLATMPDGLPVLAHPSLAGVLRADETVLFGKLFRWYGADAVIFPHAGGRFSYDGKTCRAIAQALRAAHPRVRPSCPAPAGGIKLDRIEETVAFYGPDCILLIGGSLYETGDLIGERTRALVDRVARMTLAEGR
ncbi:MAG: ribulose 1,5-bisphosphate carboxylase [Gemmatimonadales bacterium]|nr:ribulose 1,5-bisphosphate carboxylase [Gemmatimonadales bacterium]